MTNLVGCYRGEEKTGPVLSPRTPFPKDYLGRTLWNLRDFFLFLSFFWLRQDHYKYTRKILTGPRAGHHRRQRATVSTTDQIRIISRILRLGLPETLPFCFVLFCLASGRDGPRISVRFDPFPSSNSTLTL